jgi:hypothetical protein
MAWQVRYVVVSPFSNSDVSDYVIEPPKVPIYKGNDDLAPVVHGFTVVLSQTCPYTIGIANRIIISGPTTAQTFEIKKVKYERL